MSAAQTYASCLRQQGYQVNSAQPGSDGARARADHVQQQRHAQGETIDASHRADRPAERDHDGLADLECGKSYEPLAKPFVQKLMTMGAG